MLSRRSGSYRVPGRALGAIELPVARMAGPQPPILPLSVARTGHYNDIRSTPSDGACGVHGYPCRHPGLDVGGAQGTIVRAPERGQIVLKSDGASAPWQGYGPSLYVLRGASGFFHLLAHLEPASLMLPVGTVVDAGQAIATTSNANHTHWEVRRKVTPNYAGGEDNFANNLDPMSWLSRARGNQTLMLLAMGGAAVAVALYLRKRR